MLTASLRIQTNPENEKDFEGISHERLVSVLEDGFEGSLADMFPTERSQTSSLGA